MSYRASWVIQALRLDIGLPSLFGGVKRPEKYGLPVNRNAGLPLSVVFANSEQTNNVVGSRFSLVLHVLRAGYVSQIIKCVIRRIAVFMVNLVLGPCASHVKPSKPVGKVHLPINRDFNSTLVVCVPDSLPYMPNFPDHDAPLKNTSKRFVVYKLSEPVSGERSGRRFWDFFARPKEVRDSVVVLNPVLSANSLFWKAAVDVKPGKIVCPVLDAIDINLDVASTKSAPGNATSFSATTPCEPRKDASVWVVVQKFAQACCGKIGLSHDTVTSLIGQRPGSVSALAGLRYFTGRQSNLQHTFGG